MFKFSDHNWKGDIYIILNFYLVIAEGLIVLILHIDFTEIKLVVCTPVNDHPPIRPTDSTVIKSGFRGTDEGPSVFASNQVEFESTLFELTLSDLYTCIH